MSKVMVIENSDKPLRSAKKLLTSINYEIVFETDNGFEAVEKYDLINPDIVLLDLKPSKNDGLSVIKGIKKKHPESKIISVVLQPDKDLIENCLDAGASCCMTIPFKMKEFVSLMTSIDRIANRKPEVAPVISEE